MHVSNFAQYNPSSPDGSDAPFIGHKGFRERGPHGSGRPGWGRSGSNDPANGKTIYIDAGAGEQIPKNFKGTVVYSFTLRHPPPPKSTKDMKVVPNLWITPQEISQIPKDYKGVVIISFRHDEPVPKPPYNPDIDYRGVRFDKDGKGKKVDIVPVKDDPQPPGEQKGKVDLSITNSEEVLEAFERLDKRHYGRPKDGRLTRNEAGNDPLLGGQNFNRKDVDKNGKLELSELTPLGKAFTAADKNQDGKLVAAEVNASALFMSMAKDLKQEMADGKLTYGELYRHIQSKQPSGPLSPDLEGRLKKIFSRLDRSGDGKLNHTEAAHSGIWGGANFVRHDINKDGLLSEAEVAPLGESFRDADADHNGRLTENELKSGAFKGRNLSKELQDGSVSFDEMEKHVRGPQTDPQVPPKASDLGLFLAEAVIKALDSGWKDRVLAPSEAKKVALLERDFARIDVHKDDRLTAGELASYFDAKFNLKPRTDGPQ